MGAVPTRPPLARLTSAACAALLVGAIAAVPLATAMPLAASAATSSALTVAWEGDSSSAASYQPDRLPSSPHYGDFQHLSVTVSQTTDLIDQAITVTVDGFTGTRQVSADGTTITNAMNFVQAMQCWGDPADEDFRETCQWGGRGQVGFGSIVAPDNTYRSNPSTESDVPFRTVGGREVTGRVIHNGTKDEYPLLQYIGAASTNEITGARIGSDGTGSFDFETQTAITAPQLGCGKDGLTRCWLVIVPRGSHFGGGEDCSTVRDPRNNYDPYTYGRPNSIQGGSPISDLCDYWDNRIVVPLDFQPTTASCPVGSQEVRVIGSQLMVGAMTSWQPTLCQNGGSTFSFATNPDAVARAQLLDPAATSPKLAFTGYPVSSGELQYQDERTLLSQTKLAYAPVAVSSVVIGFIAEPANGRITELNLSPRLVAKLLTQSYKFTVPSNSSDVTRPFAHLGEVNRSYNYLNQDPDFRALNPDNWSQFTANPAIVLPGPAGADAITQVWRWILADPDAAAFLQGQPDPWGMTVNPYYLPKGAAGTTIPWYLDDLKNDLGQNPTTKQVGLAYIDGTPRSLTDSPLDSFPKSDQSLIPLSLNLERTRFDSIQFAPYAENLLAGARQAFRANPNSKTVWDGTKLNAAGETGDWVSSGTQLPGDKFMITITDSPSAARYSLSVAGIQVPGTDTIIRPTADAMTAALEGLTATSLDSVLQVDPRAVPEDGYPMTMVTYAAVNLTAAPAATRTAIADMLAKVTTSGQTPGTQTGTLPPGYVPLSASLASASAAAVTSIRAYVSPSASPTPKPNTNGYAQDDYVSGTSTLGGGANGGSGTDPTVTSGVDEATGMTPTSGSTPLPGNALIIALVVGALGFLIGPVLVRGFR